MISGLSLSNDSKHVILKLKNLGAPPFPKQQQLHSKNLI